jgi:hypothetical protein
MNDDEKYVSWTVHKEFADRIDERDKMQNSRIDALEQGLKEVNKITLSVERLAANIETMTAEIKKQGLRLDEIEKRPAKRWDAVVTGIIGAVVGALGAAIMTGVLH